MGVFGKSALFLVLRVWTVVWGWLLMAFVQVLEMLGGAFGSCGNGSSLVNEGYLEK